jgi:L-malate glycosyltransferase
LFDYPPYELVLASKLVDVVKYEKLDLLHVHYAIPHASAAYMARQILKEEGIYIPFITTLHGTDITLVGKDSSFEPVITFAINQSDAVTAVSESLRADTYNHFKVTREVEVIPNFVCMLNYSSDRNNGLRSAYAPNGEKILIHVSNFRKVKRVEDVVGIFTKVRAQMPVKLVFIGDGPQRSSIEQMCREMGTCNDIKFLGKMQEPEDILPIADLFLLTSESESFGLSALEAMACGVPVISTNTGGIPEVNVDGVTGFLSDVGDVDSMASNALKLLQNDTLHDQFRINALNRAKEFDIRTILPLYEELYERVVEQSRVLK